MTLRWQDFASFVEVDVQLVGMDVQLGKQIILVKVIHERRDGEAQRNWKSII